MKWQIEAGGVPNTVEKEIQLFTEPQNYIVFCTHPGTSKTTLEWDRPSIHPPPELQN